MSEQPYMAGGLSRTPPRAINLRMGVIIGVKIQLCRRKLNEIPNPAHPAIRSIAPD
jgi:hypothetical protein